MIDIVIVGEMNDITKACLTSLEASYYDNNIIVVSFDGYNRSLNRGAIKGHHEYIAFCNNDLEFKKDWDLPIIRALEGHNIVSASPLCPLTYKQWWGNEVPINNTTGTQTGKIVAGWCMILKRKWWEEMGGFDERLEFFCCDNSYTMQLEQANKLHILIPASKVIHYQSSTLNQFKGTQKYDDLTMGEVRKYNRLYNKNLFNAGT